MEPAQFTDLVATITRRIAGKPLDANLESELNAAYPGDSAAFHDVFEACRAGIAAGWICNREAGGIRYGRVVKSGPATHGFSIDVVEMNDIAGPHHRHPNGEIDLVMPLEGNARFDGRGAGWMVYEPGTAHRPTVSGGKALILYLLPDGAIEFTKA
ncbi:MAG TPA: DUF4863 family protein [Casimicrobiaceae bacterium]|nr:DUF4863 family protein [Casimicrobiaceae bacterium]